MSAYFVLSGVVCPIVMRDGCSTAVGGENEGIYI